MDVNHTQNLQATALSLFSISTNIFWQALPVAFLFAMLTIFVRSEISGSSFEKLFRRVILAILLLVAFPQISKAFLGLESTLIDAFGGQTDLNKMFTQISDSAKHVRENSAINWFKVGELGMNIITTLSFLVLSIVKRFLDVLQICLWNLLHVLGPLALLGCLFPTFHSIPKGIFLGLFELTLWKPLWVILARILIAIGFGESPTGVSDWFNVAIMNFAVAGLMITTPMLVHGFLNGALAAVGGSAIQTMISGAAPAMMQVPMKSIQYATRSAKNVTMKGASWMTSKLTGSKLPEQKPKEKQTGSKQNERK